MAFPTCTKTVFLLDHTHWMQESNGVQIEIETNGNGSSGSGGGRSSARGAGLNYFNTSFIPPVSKSLWTSSVETVLEYCRVMFDLFANERLVRVALCQGQQGHLIWLNDWELFDQGVQQQSTNYLSEKFANAGPPQDSYKSSNVSNIAAISLGIQSAIEALGQPTPAQQAFMNGQGGYNKTNLKAINKGRVICITSCTAQSVGNGSAESLIDLFDNVLSQHNRMVAPASDHLLPILECEFLLMSIHPFGKTKYSVISPRPVYEVSPILNCQVAVSEGDKACQLIMDLCVVHHDLVSTTVTNIPMKEEQNSNSSSNYDVPLYHARLSTSGVECSVLKWSSPSAPKTGVGAGAGGLVHHCTTACRITPVDVNSRPSTCLSSFLINGRSVWLEMLKKGKTISHMLTSHGGEMWMHVIETARNVLEDPPSISEGIGGRVTDYRIPDFADFMKMNMLIPFPKNYQEHIIRTKPDNEATRDSANPFIRRRSSSLEDLKKPIEMAKDRLQRKTNYWPMTISGSLLFNISVHVESLLRLMPQDSMTDMEKVECDTSIWTLMSVEARGEPAIPSGHHKKTKRDEQWRSVYAELETFIKANLHSENHKKVLECFQESRKMDSKIDGRSTEDKNGTRAKEDNKTIDLAQPESMMTDSPMSPPPANNGKSSEAPLPSSNKRTLLSLWTAKTEKKDFRMLTNTKLYSHLSSGAKGHDANTDSERKQDVVKT